MNNSDVYTLWKIDHCIHIQFTKEHILNGGAACNNMRAAILNITYDQNQLTYTAYLDEWKEWNSEIEIPIIKKDDTHIKWSESEFWPKASVYTWSEPYLAYPTFNIIKNDTYVAYKESASEYNYIQWLESKLELQILDEFIINAEKDINYFYKNWPVWKQKIEHWALRNQTQTPEELYFNVINCDISNKNIVYLLKQLKINCNLSNLLYLNLIYKLNI